MESRRLPTVLQPARTTAKASWTTLTTLRASAKVNAARLYWAKIAVRDPLDETDRALAEAIDSVAKSG